ncbi:cell division protein ZapE [Novosphingobium decolorationis]|uniref:Cell division protein ZapE n=1 Tax=Novosphingobium decolorationis TaxID=2698673 RepID=A0ABX8E331_9SPHN|nr:cell division protein ZapE [Novosphingobium decolorationis]MED5546488.1 cell division protein ZapE [Pseudomonadota bacterium]QVM82431.1 cell division protein ZapE [Novosphingobium decolorationis]
MTAMLGRYETLVATGELRSDPEQAAVAERLDQLQRAFYKARNSTGLFGKLLGKKAPSPRGVYMWGGVGRGKSMLMDLFHQTLDITAKRRVHFHAFMLEVHALLNEERKKESGDPIPPVAATIARNVQCLAFDEMVVNNSADAMIMSRLFTQLIEHEGVTIVTTSNRAPSELYKDGLNREHFLPFIDLIEQELDVYTLNGPTDYRLQRLGGMATWHTPLGEEATEQTREAFYRLTDYPPEDAEHVPPADIDVGGGRLLHVPKSLKGVGVFSFKRLCAEARGASDYLAIARAYHTVIVVGIPRMGPDRRNEAARFVTLIDALYENKVKLIAAADASPEELYEAGTGRFEFERTVSRLNEMQSADYLAKGHGED